MLGVVVAEADRTVALGAEQPPRLVAHMAMIDAQRRVGSLADRAGAILPLQHRLVVGQGDPVDLLVALPALPFAVAGALALAKVRIGLQPELPALAHLLLVL